MPKHFEDATHTTLLGNGDGGSLFSMCPYLSLTGLHYIPFACDADLPVR
jgi:hypothetical protein